MAVHRVPIGDRIKNQRRSAGVTQRDLASAVGVSSAYLSLIESDKRQIGGSLLNRIAARLGVPADVFTAVSDDRLAADLAEIVSTLPEGGPPNAAELVAFSPEWADLVVRLHARQLAAEARAFRLADRFARDPEWVDRAHDILSRITSIRSAAEILTELEEGDAAPAASRSRFVRSLAAESRRLTDVAQAMIASLKEGVAADAAGADVRAVDAVLEDRCNHFDAIEAAVARLDPPSRQLAPSERFAAARAVVRGPAASAIAEAVEAADLATEGATKRLFGALERYAAAALLMPYEPFRQAAHALRHDIEALAARFQTSYEQVCHRLTTLRRPGGEGVPYAFLRVDPAGPVWMRLSTASLRLPLFGSCPLWAVYDCLSQPGRIVTQLADLEGERFLFVARSLEKTPRRHAQPPGRFAVMLGTSIEHAGDIVYGDGLANARPSQVTFAGYDCHTCRRDGCAQRAHRGQCG